MTPLAIIKNLAGNQALIFQMLMFALVALMFLAFCIYSIVHSAKKRTGYVRAAIFSLLLCPFSYLFMRMAVTNYKLLTDYTYVIGETVARCASGEENKPGASFKYTYQGKEYTHCEIINENMVMIPHKYKVRVSPHAPSHGVIDFSQPVR